MLNQKTIHRKEKFSSVNSTWTIFFCDVKFYFMLQVIPKSLVGTCAYSFTFLYAAVTSVKIPSNRRA